MFASKTRSKLFPLLGSLLLMLSIPVLSPAQQVPQPPARPALPDLPLQSILAEAALIATTGGLEADEYSIALGKRGLEVLSDGQVHVEIVGPTGSAAVPDALLRSVGGRVENRWRNQVDAWIPAERLLDAARALPEGHYLMQASFPDEDDVAGEGPAAINSDSYRDAGADGSGLTIAVIDTGFWGLTDARGNGDAPAVGITTQINYTGTDFEWTTSHGVGCVEAAFDHCPGATWRLYKITTTTDLGLAVDDAISNGVDVISHSISWYNSGWADNSGPTCAAAPDAAAAGILFFTSAGNRALSHWQGDMLDADADSFHEWAPGDETVDIVVDDGTTAKLRLAWDTTGGTYNYDLFLWDAGINNVLASSTNTGNDFEALGWTNDTGATVVVHVSIKKVSGGITEMELFGNNSTQWNEFMEAEGSTTSPSNCTNELVISVGAVAWDLYESPGGTAGIIKDFSSQGPSNSGNALPRLCGPTDTTGFTYPGGFGGTSAAAPNAAGAACAFWSSDPLLAAGTISWLTSNQAYYFRDWGNAGNDYIYGYGGINYYDWAPGTLWVSRAYGNVTNNRAYPFYTYVAAEAAASIGGRLLNIGGGNYPETFSLNKALTVKALKYTAILGE